MFGSGALQCKQPSSVKSEKASPAARLFLSSRDVKELHRSVDQQLLQEDIYEAVPRPDDSHKTHDIIIIIIHELLLYVEVIIPWETSGNHI